MSLLVLLCVFSLVMLCVGLLIKYWRVMRDLHILIERVSLLLRSGRVHGSEKFFLLEYELLWKKVLSFYAGVGRSEKVKDELVFLLSSSGGALKSQSENLILHTLSDMLYRLCSPEGLFVGVGVVSPNGSFSMEHCKGIAVSRVENALLSAIDCLSLVPGEVSFQHTRPENRREFDFRGLGIGLSLFATFRAVNGAQVAVWVGFSEGNLGFSDIKRRQVEEVIRQAAYSYSSSLEHMNAIAEQCEATNRVVELSHDMKTPGVRALYALRELRESSANLSDEIERLVEEAEESIEEQLGLIEAVFRTTPTINAHDDVRQIPEFDISKIARRRVEAFGVVARAVDVEIKFGNFVPARYRIPKDVCTRILDNLISNAIKYAAGSEVIVSVEASDSGFDLIVADNGPGVDVEIQPHLFSSQMKVLCKDKSKSSGVGLYVVSKLAVQYGALVRYEKNLPAGSRFIVSFPRTSSRIELRADSLVNSSDEISGSLPPTGISRNSSKFVADNKQIIVVDDDAVVRKAHMRWLQGFDAEVCGYESFSIAKTFSHVATARLIVCDANIGLESLYEFIVSLPRESKVLLVTAMRLEEARNEYEGLPQVVGVLEKPVTRVQLRACVRKLLSESYDKKNVSIQSEEFSSKAA